MMIDWKAVCVEPATSMQDALKVIDQGRLQIALVTDPNFRLLGTVTDGDIRRALIRGEGLDTPVQSFMNATPVTGFVAEDPAGWQRAMQRHSLQHIPILDVAGCVVDLIRLTQPEEPQRSNLVVLMAGGMGTRLRPLTNTQPKPLLRVGNKPILETIVENFAAHGFKRFALCINYKGEMIRDHFGNGSALGVDVRYIEEGDPLGTAGALSLLPYVPDEPFFAMNGDVLTKVDFVRLLEFHKRQQVMATMCVRDFYYQVPYGVVRLTGHRIEAIQEKPVDHYHVNAGIYVLEPDVLKIIPKGQYFDMPMLFQALLDQNAPTGSFPLRDYWIDIGQMDQFQKAEHEFNEHFQ